MPVSYVGGVRIDAKMPFVYVFSSSFSLFSFSFKLIAFPPAWYRCQLRDLNGVGGFLDAPAVPMREYDWMNG